MTPPVGRSHHDCLTFTIRCYAEVQSSQRPTRSYHKGDFDGFRSFLQSHQWQSTEESSAQEIWEELSTTLKSGTDKFIPLVKSDPNRLRDQPWMTKELKKLIKDKAEAFRIKRRDEECPEAKAAYAEKCRLVNQEKRSAIKQYESQVAERAKTNPKLFYKTVNQRLKVRDSVPILETPAGNKAVTNEEKAEALNNCFSSVYGIEDPTSIPEVPSRTTEKLDDVAFSVDDVVKLLLAVNPYKSMGPDELHPVLLRELAHQIAPIVHLLFRRTLDTGMVPHQWKMAHITPIFKKGKKSDPGNYRPVSLTSCLCKIFERLITAEILNHLERNKLLSECQYGFRPNRSCQWQLMNVIETWTDMLEDGEPIDCVFFDFRKAFDMVPHLRLAKKVEAHGITGKLKAWIENYLSGRQQRVAVNGVLSDPAPVTSGVPQGSVIGPILFLLFINDLPELARNLVRLFADDTKLFGRARTIEDCQRLQEDIDKFESWSDTSGMSFHPMKCKRMRIGKGHAPMTYTMTDENGNKVELATVNEEKDLGVIIDRDLSFKSHVSEVTNKATQKVGSIKRGFKYINKPVFNTLYKSQVRPGLEYGHAVWKPNQITELRRIEQVQRRATKLVASIRRLSYEGRLVELNLPSMMYRLRRGDMIEVWKVLNNCYSGEFPWVTVQQTSTRGNSQKLLYKNKMNTAKRKAFSFRIQEDWRKLPRWVAGAATLNSFKTSLDKHWSHLKYVHPGP